MKTLVVFLLFFLSLCNDILWKSYSDGMEEILQTKQPGIVLIHHSSCPACISLHKIIQSSKEIQNLSRNYVMISCKDGYLPSDPAYNGDGKYVPRLFFVSPKGEVLLSIKASDVESKFKYYYYNEDQLVNKMKYVLALHGVHI